MPDLLAAFKRLPSWTFTKLTGRQDVREGMTTIPRHLRLPSFPTGGRVTCWNSASKRREEMKVRKPSVSPGDVYVDIKPPRREWRVSRLKGDSIVLERLDKPSTLRFLSLPELSDPLRYRRKK